MCLAAAMIGVLAQDDHLNIFKGGMIKGIKYQLPWWIDAAGGGFLYQEFLQFTEIGRLEFVPEDVFPPLIDIWLYL